MDEKLSKLETDVSDIKQRASKAETEIAVFKNDVGHIKGYVSELHLRVRDVREHQERDFRVLFGALISMALGLAAVMAKGFGWFH